MQTVLKYWKFKIWSEPQLFDQSGFEFDINFKFVIRRNMAFVDGAVVEYTTVLVIIYMHLKSSWSISAEPQAASAIYHKQQTFIKYSHITQ